jgi:primosomal protein N' (replication factor Y)
LIRDVLDAGKQVLYLLPEITLTKQIIDRVKGAFGDKVGIYHSRFSDNERVEIWHKVRKREFDVVVGVRSATFLPWSDLGLIVVDEEHDHSFKQNEPSPRYNARDVAVYYAGQFGCPVILGSATPSMESYQNALSGKYLMSEIHNRAVEAQLPELVMIDMRVERKTRPVKGIFSLPMRQAIESTLAKGEQVILFQNRRGYAPYQICTNCGHVPMCINCDISLTYHKGPQHSRCHYCGHTEYLQDKCPECGNFTLKKQGIGTERIEEEVKEHFPNHTVERMDLDTTRGKLKFQHLLNRFERGQVEILVGTQMVSKGLDFENVTLVGVVNADHLLTFPDFRAHERAYQLLTQVSGRAGRSKKKGYVVIQTHMPENIVLQSLEKPYALFFEQEFRHRRQLSYPPLSRLLKIEMRHKDRAFLEVESLRLDAILRPYFKKYLLGPDYALIARVRNQYRMQFLVKIPKGVSSQNLRKTLAAYIDHYYKIAPEKTLRIILDVDPV